MRVQEDAHRVSADEVETSNDNTTRLHALCNEQARANQALVLELPDLIHANHITSKVCSCLLQHETASVRQAEN